MNERAVPFSDRSTAMKVVLAGVAPAAIGALAGVMLGVSSVAYWIVSAIAAIGGLLAGLEHFDSRGAAARGFVGGLVYGVALLLAHAVAGTDAEVSLGSFPPLLALITAVIGAILGALGERLARRGR